MFKWRNTFSIDVNPFSQYRANKTKLRTQAFLLRLQYSTTVPRLQLSRPQYLIRTIIQDLFRRRTVFLKFLNMYDLFIWGIGVRDRRGGNRRRNRWRNRRRNRRRIRWRNRWSNRWSNRGRGRDSGRDSGGGHVLALAFIDS